MTELIDIFKAVKSDFCNLMDYKMRGSTIEILTSVSTITDHYVSVFISYKKGTYIVSDGGWLDRQYYDNTTSVEDEDIIQRIELQYRGHFGINRTIHTDGTKYNFKTTENSELISTLVYEVSHYVSSVVNSQSVAYQEAKEQSQRQRFYQDVNGFLKETYGGDLALNETLQNYNDELSMVKFNAIVRRPTKIHLVMYVTGYTPQNFIKDACEATVNFQIASKYTGSDTFSKTAIVNTLANGYTPLKVNEYLTNLEEQTNKQLLSFYNQRDNLIKYIPPKSLGYISS